MNGYNGPNESKEGIGALYHENCVKADYTDLEPLITPDKLKGIHLFGIPLVSAQRDPITNRPQIMTDDLIKDFIQEAIALAEAESKLELLPRQIKEKQPFDRALYDSFSYCQLRHRPVFSLEKITVTASDQEDLYIVPLTWVDIGYLHLGQVNLIPLTLSIKSGNMVPLASNPAGAVFLSIWGSRSFIPSFWQYEYRVGFPDAQFPKIINQYIGVIAAMEILSVLATTYSRTTSSSLSVDGLSQSSSTPGAEIFAQRLSELGDKRRWLLGRLQASFNMKIVVDNV